MALTGKVASQADYLKSLGAAEVILKFFYVNFRVLLLTMIYDYFLNAEIFKFGLPFFQCSGSMTFWCGSGSGSADPCL